MQIFWRHFLGLENMLGKKKGARLKAFRIVFSAIARAIGIPNETLADYLGLNRKTLGENQARPEIWARQDSETARVFAEHFDHLENMIYHEIHFNPQAFEEALIEMVDEDKKLAKLEELQKELERGAREADAAADESKQRNLARRIARLQKSLKGLSSEAKVLARQLDPHALEALARLIRNETKGRREPESHYPKLGVIALKEIKLAMSAEPHLSKTTDPKLAPTKLGASVYAEVIAMGIEATDKRRRA